MCAGSEIPAERRAKGMEGSLGKQKLNAADVPQNEIGLKTKKPRKKGRKTSLSALGCSEFWSIPDVGLLALPLLF